MKSDPEQVVYDALIDGEGYYPVQLAPRIVEALRNAGFDLPEPAAEQIPRESVDGWFYLLRYPDHTVVQCPGDWDVAHKHLRALRIQYEDDHRRNFGKRPDSTVVLIGAYGPRAVGGPEGKGGVFSYGYRPTLIGSIDHPREEWIPA